jgi:hypothetical protein
MHKGGPQEQLGQSTGLMKCEHPVRTVSAVHARYVPRVLRVCLPLRRLWQAGRPAAVMLERRLPRRRRRAGHPASAVSQSVRPGSAVEHRELRALARRVLGGCGNEQRLDERGRRVHGRL